MMKNVNSTELNINVVYKMCVLTVFTAVTMLKTSKKLDPSKRVLGKYEHIFKKYLPLTNCNFYIIG